MERYLNITINLVTRVIKQATDKNILTYYGNAVLVANEKLVSTLVRKSHTNNISITLQHLGMEPGYKLYKLYNTRASFLALYIHKHALLLTSLNEENLTCTLIP